MAATTSGGSDSKLKLDTGGALASIGFNSMIDGDQAPSSGDEMIHPDFIGTDDVQSAIGVSISREQTRLTSPLTPAIEKAAVIEKTGFFFGGFDDADHAMVEEVDEDEEVAGAEESDHDDIPAESEQDSVPLEPVSKSTSTQVSITDPEPQLPSPWRVNAQPQWQTGKRPRSGIFDGFLHRKNMSTGSTSTLGSSQKSLLASLPLLPKHFSISSSSTTRQDSESDSKVPQPSANIQAYPITEEPIEIGSPNDNTRRGSLQAPRARAPLLRRSTSDQTLAIQRALTRAETLGDDSRFDDVHDQVNSRLKAIKDSWQDANIKLPGVPAIKVSSLTAESIKERVGSLNKSQTTRSLSVVDDRAMTPTHSKPVDPLTRHPSDVRSAMVDTAAEKMHPHPHFHHALEQLEGDVVILGGYRGSILRSAKPPHRQVWVPIKVGLNLRKVNLEVGFKEEDDERAKEQIVPDGMLTHIGPVDISRRLLKRLRFCDNARTGKLRVHEYGYDWRLMPRHLSQQMIRFLENLPCNKEAGGSKKRGATVIAHSLGGLITRHAVNQRPDLFAGVVYAGVPQTCVNILGPLRNGDEVLISNRVLTAQVNFSIRTSFALLPLDGRCFFDKETKEQYPVDFFDVDTWDELRLSPCINRPLPPLQPPPKPTGITAYMASMLPSIPGRGRKDSEKPSDTSKVTSAQGVATINPTSSDATSSDLGGDVDKGESVRTAVTVSRSEAREYLQRTLASVKSFKEELAFNPQHADANSYPPFAVIYGKSIPTVYGARVDGREGIKHADAYDDLAFASGDGVVLARAAMVPEGYKTARGGIAASDRGHVTLLGDLEAVGKCLHAVIRARRKGVGVS